MPIRRLIVLILTTVLVMLPAWTARAEQPDPAVEYVWTWIITDGRTDWDSPVYLARKSTG